MVFCVQKQIFISGKTTLKKSFEMNQDTGPRQPVACFTHCSIYAHPEEQRDILKTVMPVYSRHSRLCPIFSNAHMQTLQPLQFPWDFIEVLGFVYNNVQ